MVVVEYQNGVAAYAAAGGVDARRVVQVCIEYRQGAGVAALFELVVVKVKLDFRTFEVFRGIEVEAANNEILESAKSFSLVFRLRIVGDFSRCKIVTNIVGDTEGDVELALHYRGLASKQDG